LSEEKSNRKTVIDRGTAHSGEKKFFTKNYTLCKEEKKERDSFQKTKNLFHLI